MALYVSKLKRGITLFLVVVVLLNSFSSALLIAGYEFNKGYITAKFCVNKSKPMLHCNGKCHLQKQLKEEQKREQNPTTSNKEKQEVVQYCESLSGQSFSIYSVEKINLFSYQENEFPDVYFSFFHPPSC